MLMLLLLLLLLMTDDPNRHYTHPLDNAPSRLDKALSGIWEDVSRTFVQKLITEGRVSVDGTPVLDPSFKVQPGQDLVVHVPRPAPLHLVAEAMALDIVYEDKHLIVINKPPGLVVHPAVGHAQGTLVHGLLHHCRGELSGISGVERPGIVHRLDKETSGLMVVAKTNEAHLGLAAQFGDQNTDKQLKRTYTALVHGVVSPNRDTIVTQIGRHPKDRQRQAVLKYGGREAITHYSMLRPFPQHALSLVSCVLETGRTHQIRVHMSHKNWPVVGDAVYGSRRSHKLSDAFLRPLLAANLWRPERHALHAHKLDFIHPATQELMSFEAPIPPDMTILLQTLEENKPYVKNVVS